MKLILSEKPSVARDIARVLGITHRHEGYIEGKGCVVTWALGHLIEFCQPDDYGEQFHRWTFDTLPIIPETFKKKVIDSSAAQYDVVKSLCQRQDLTEIICATDAGREGELIFRTIYQETGCMAPIRRLWISSQTDAAIKEGFAQLKPGSDYQPLYDSALSRAEADWLVGINATRAYSIKFSRGRGVMSVGRVQTPVLKMIVERYREHIRFDSRTFYEIFVDRAHTNGTFRAKWMGGEDDRLFDKDTATALADAIKAIPSGTIALLTEKEKVEKQPLLYDLTELQKEANQKFKFSADQTLKLMQDLYEKYKLLTYPRTSSSYLGTDIVPQLPNRLQNLADIPDYAFVQDILANKRTIADRLIDNDKVTDHHAIIPTDKKPNPSELPADHRAIYDMVIRRFLAAFMPECLKHHTEIIATFGEHRFKATGTVITQLGWRQLYAQDDDLGKESKPLLPKVAANDPVKNAKTELKKGQTKAPPLHTEATLLAAMETAGRSIEDEELRQAMKNCGLGTPATRAQILEKLIHVTYIVRDKNKLLPTPKGEYLIDAIIDPVLLSAELTGTWEKKLNDIAQSKFERVIYMNDIKSFTESVVANVVQSTAYTLRADQKVYGDCPKCQIGKIIETPKAYGCTQWKSAGCKFVIWKEMSGKALTENQVETLLKKGLTPVIKGFKNKAGNPFEAALKLVDGDVQFNFHRDAIGTCPLCTASVVETAKAYSCDQWRVTGCGFAIWKSMANRTITLAEAQTLLTSGQTEVLTGFSSKIGKPFDAGLKLVNGKAEFWFR
ncbi:MAG: DNA topoisomerase 3 [Candidatus Margulisiibacteriota bacterium]